MLFSHTCSSAENQHSPQATIYAMPNDSRDAVRQDEEGGGWTDAAGRRAACGVCGTT